MRTKKRPEPQGERRDRPRRTRRRRWLWHVRPGRRVRRHRDAAEMTRPGTAKAPGRALPHATKLSRWPAHAPRVARPGLRGEGPTSAEVVAHALGATSQ